MAPIIVEDEDEFHELVKDVFAQVTQRISFARDWCQKFLDFQRFSRSLNAISLEGKQVQEILDDLFCVVEERIDRGDDDSRLDREDLDADERDANPDVDNDALIEDPVEHFCKAEIFAFRVSNSTHSSSSSSSVLSLLDPCCIDA
jgi:hypothetical protein